MSDATLNRLAKLSPRELIDKLEQLELKRRIVVALIRARPRDVPERRRRKGVSHAR